MTPWKVRVSGKKMGGKAGEVHEAGPEGRSCGQNAPKLLVKVKRAGWLGNIGQGANVILPIPKGTVMMLASVASPRSPKMAKPAGLAKLGGWIMLMFEDVPKGIVTVRNTSPAEPFTCRTS